jgi:uncharacterized membrane protein YqhA
MELEKKVEDLEKRLEKLEAKERRRTIIGIIKAAIVVVIAVAIIIVGIKVYNQFMEKMRPIMEIQEKSEDLGLDSIFDYFK